MRQNHESFAQIHWEISDDGALTVRGTGLMPDYSPKNDAPAPWQGCMEKIRTVFIEEGISSIGTRAFENCSGLTKVSLPLSLKKIGSYAFRHCTSLTEIDTADRKDTVFRYILDKKEQICEGEILFGLQAFLGVPWAYDYFGDYYIRDDVFYISFGRNSVLKVPEGVRTVCLYAFQESPADTVILPASLETINGYAFLHSGVEYLRILGVDGSSLKIAPNALAGSRLRFLELPQYINNNLSASLFKGTPLEKEINRLLRKSGKRRMSKTPNEVFLEKEIRIPELFTLRTTPLRKESAFRKLKVRVKKNPESMRKTSDAFFAKRGCDFTGEMLTRFSRDQVLISICWFQNRVLYIRSMIPDRNTNMLAEYTMYPCVYGQDHDPRIGVWSETLRYREKEYITSLFSKKYPDALDPEGLLRDTPSGLHEEWFVYTGAWDFGGKAELDFLREWSAAHPEIAIDTEEENRIKDRFRWTAASSCI